MFVVLFVEGVLMYCCSLFNQESIYCVYQNNIYMHLKYIELRANFSDEIVCFLCVVLCNDK
jgi:hypothetical protein